MSAVQHEDLMFEITWILTNLTSSESVSVIDYITSESFLFEFLNDMLQSENHKILENALWSFSNLMSEKQELMKTAIDTLLIETIQKQIDKDEVGLNIVRA